MQIFTSFNAADIYFSKSVCISVYRGVSSKSYLPPSFIVHCLDNITLVLVKSKVSRLQLVSVAEQAGPSRTWLDISEGRFFRDVAHLTQKAKLSHVIENLLLPYANNKAADQPVHPYGLISTFVVHCLDNMILLLAIGP